MRNVTLPVPKPRPDGIEAWYPIRVNDTAPTHLLNWALLLVLRRRVRPAIHLIERAIEGNRQLGYAHGVLALLHTLNEDWEPAIAAARTARDLGAEAFTGANDLCILAAQFGLGFGMDELDPVFDWSAFCAEEVRLRHLDRLPSVEGLPFPQFPPGVLVYFICCDTDYFLEHGVALACSIRETCRQGAIHLHLFNPAPEAWSALRGLRTVVAPLPLSVTGESVEFDRYGSKSLYCACARFSRLYQLLLSTENRIVMLDADSLLRGDLAPALAGCREIGLVHARHEPLWHRYLAGVTCFRKSPAAKQFLRDLSAFLSTNLAGGRARLYIDQIALYACAYRCERASSDAIDYLPIEKFCDTLFRDEALVWSITQNKSDDGPFARYKHSVLRRYENPCG